MAGSNNMGDKKFLKRCEFTKTVLFYKQEQEPIWTQSQSLNNGKVRGAGLLLLSLGTRGEMPTQW